MASYIASFIVTVVMGIIAITWIVGVPVLTYRRIRFGKHGHVLKGRILFSSPEVPGVCREPFEDWISVVHSSNKERPIGICLRIRNAGTLYDKIRVPSRVPQSLCAPLTVGEANGLNELLLRSLDLVETSMDVTEVGRNRKSLWSHRVVVVVVDPAQRLIQFRVGGARASLTIDACHDFKSHLKAVMSQVKPAEQPGTSPNGAKGS